MSYLEFEEEGHRYFLTSALPLTWGDYPRKIWIVHLKDYLPSQHRGGAKSSDNLTSVGMGGLSGYLAPPGEVALASSEGRNTKASVPP